LFSPGTPVYSTNKTDLHYIAEILLKVGLNTISTTTTYEILRFASEIKTGISPSEIKTF
jgi:hypothetical protein